MKIKLKPIKEIEAQIEPQNFWGVYSRIFGIRKEINTPEEILSYWEEADEGLPSYERCKVSWDGKILTHETISGRLLTYDFQRKYFKFETSNPSVNFAGEILSWLWVFVEDPEAITITLEDA